MSSKRITRRSLLATGTATTLALAFGSITGTSLADASEAGSTYQYQPIFFDPDNWDTLQAFVDRIIPADESGPGALEAHVPEFIDRQMMMPYGYGKLRYMQPPFLSAPKELGSQSPLTPRDVYKFGLKSLAEYVHSSTGKKFSDLTGDARDQILHAMEKGDVHLSTVPASMLFAQILKNCREGYFSDPVHGGNFNMAAWKMIGFPGARADFTDWVGRYGARYPFAPVSVSDKVSG